MSFIFNIHIQKNIIGKNFSIPILRFYNIAFSDVYEKEFKINHNSALFDEINKLQKLNK
jgi:hypothetical protein